MNGKRCRMQKLMPIKTVTTSAMSAGTATSRPWISRIIRDELTQSSRSKLRNEHQQFSCVSTVIKVILAVVPSACVNIGAKRRMMQFMRSIKPRKLRNYRTLTRRSSRGSRRSNNAWKAPSREPRTGLTKSFGIVLWSMPSRKVRYRQRRNEKFKRSDREILRKRDRRQRPSAWKSSRWRSRRPLSMRRQVERSKRRSSKKSGILIE